MAAKEIDAVIVHVLCAAVVMDISFGSKVWTAD
jgi:hypothetical protein